MSKGREIRTHIKLKKDKVLRGEFLPNLMIFEDLILIFLIIFIFDDLPPSPSFFLI